MRPLGLACCAVIASSVVLCAQQVGIEQLPEWADAELTEEIHARLEGLGADAAGSDEQRERAWQAVVAFRLHGRGENTDAYRVLGQHPLPAVFVVAAALVNGEAEVRQKAILAAGALLDSDHAGRPAEIVPILALIALRSAGDPDAEVRARSATLLGVIGGGSQVRPLLPRFLDEGMRVRLVTTLRRLRRDDDRMVSESAEYALFDAGGGPSPESGGHLQGLTVAANVFGELFRSGETIPLLIALGYAGDGPIWLGVQECLIEVTPGTSDARYRPAPNTRRISTGFWHYDTARPRQTVEVGGRRLHVDPVEEMQPGGWHAEINSTWQAGMEPLPPGEYTIVVHVDLMQCAAESVIPLEGTTPPWGSADETAHFYVRSTPIRIEVW